MFEMNFSEWITFIYIICWEKLAVEAGVDVNVALLQLFIPTFLLLLYFILLCFPFHFSSRFLPPNTSSSEFYESPFCDDTFHLLFISLKVNKSIAKSLKIIIHFIRYAFIGIVMKEKRLTMVEKKERERESDWSPLLFITRRIHVRPSRTQCARSFILLLIVHRVLSNAVWSVRNLHFSITTFSINKT